MLNAQDIDDQFNLRKRHPLGRCHLFLNAAESLLARIFLQCTLDVRYGDSAGQMLDIFPAKMAGAPVFVFIHGGYFRALDKSQYRYIARQMGKAGYTVVLINYDLAPHVTVSEITRQVLRAFGWILENIERWNGDPDRIILCGHSVGAFLAVKILERSWPERSGIRKAALLSGLYDLGPMKQSYLNRDLQLTDADVKKLNPQVKSLLQRPDLLVAVGKEETDQFISQSENYSHNLSEAGISNQLLILDGINHYTMSRLLAHKSNSIVNWITADSTP